MSVDYETHPDESDNLKIFKETDNAFMVNKLISSVIKKKLQRAKEHMESQIMTKFSGGPNAGAQNRSCGAQMRTIFTTEDSIDKKPNGW